MTDAEDKALEAAAARGFDPETATNSTHRVEVFLIQEIIPHPDPETVRLAIVEPWGYQCVVGKDQFQAGDLAAYLPPDSVVPNEGPFRFLFKEDAPPDATLRIRARKFRGCPSQGLLIPAPAGSVEDDDVAELLGVTHYEPTMKANPGHGVSMGDGRAAPAPVGMDLPKYGMESWRRYGESVFAHLVAENDGNPVEVSITEKIHGANGRWVYDGERLHAGSHNRWLLESESCPWWTALHSSEKLKSFLYAHPGVCAYGELFGQIQALRYGSESGDTPKIAVFDLREMGKWWSAVNTKAALDMNGVLAVPELYRGPYAPEVVEGLLEHPTVMGGKHHREGVVIKTTREHYHRSVGRVILKVVSQAYLEKGK